MNAFHEVRYSFTIVRESDVSEELESRTDHRSATRCLHRRLLCQVVVHLPGTRTFDAGYPDIPDDLVKKDKVRDETSIKSVMTVGGGSFQNYEYLSRGRWKHDSLSVELY
jgi:hypothetical protein